MSDVRILRRLVKFLTIHHSEKLASLDTAIAAAKLENEKNKLAEEKRCLIEDHENLVKQIKKGFCFGLALCDGAMELMGKQEWWYALLSAIIQWDKKPETLNQIITLPDAEPLPLIKSKESTPFVNRQNTLDILMLRALNYITFNHAIKTASSIFDLTQHSILNPPEEKEQSYFQFVDPKGNIYAIKSHNKIAGHFTQEQLLVDLREEDFSRCIVLIHDIDHTIRLGFDSKIQQWFIYNSNFNHTDPKTIRKMGTKEEIINELFKILGQDLCFEFAACDPNRKLSFPQHENQTPENLCSIIKENGILMLGIDDPKKLFSILEQAEESEILEKGIIASFQQFNNLINNKTLVLQKFIQNASIELQAILNFAKKKKLVVLLYKKIFSML